MRRRQLSSSWSGCRQSQGQELTRDQLLMKLGAAQQEAPGALAAWSRSSTPRKTRQPASLEFTLDREKLRQVRRREGRYLLRTNLTADDPTSSGQFYIQLTEVEQAFKELKRDLAMRPIYHQNEERIEAHIFVAFLAYCLQVTLKARLRPWPAGSRRAPCSRKFKPMQMVDVHCPPPTGAS